MNNRYSNNLPTKKNCTLRRGDKKLSEKSSIFQGAIIVEEIFVKVLIQRQNASPSQGGGEGRG